MTVLINVKLLKVTVSSLPGPKRCLLSPRITQKCLKPSNKITQNVWCFGSDIFQNRFKSHKVVQSYDNYTTAESAYKPISLRTPSVKVLATALNCMNFILSNLFNQRLWQQIFPYIFIMTPCICDVDFFKSYSDTLLLV